MKKIFVTVSGGVAEFVEDTVPKGFDVEIIDFDNIRAGNESLEFPRSDWQYEVANGDTSLGYEDWIDHRLEALKA